MGHFREAYRGFCKLMNVLLEADKRGLRVRLENFFYDPKNQTYNREFRERWLKEIDACREHLEEISEENRFSVRRQKTQFRLVGVIYRLLHPINVSRLNRISED